MLILGLVTAWRGRKEDWWRVWEYRLGLRDRARPRGVTANVWRSRREEDERRGEGERLVGGNEETEAV